MSEWPDLKRHRLLRAVRCFLLGHAWTEWQAGTFVIEWRPPEPPVGVIRIESRHCIYHWSTVYERREPATPSEKVTEEPRAE